MGAVRGPGFTKRDRILVVEGGFHGLYDEMMWRSDEQGVVPFGGGLPESTRANVDFIELNDAEGLEHALKHGAPVAAVVLEPIMGNSGSISATPEYMRTLRDACTAHGTMLIMDEVKTGFRSLKVVLRSTTGCTPTSPPTPRRWATATRSRHLGGEPTSWTSSPSSPAV